MSQIAKYLYYQHPHELGLNLYPHCTLIVAIKVQFQNSTFGPYAYHLAPSVSEPESSKIQTISEYLNRDQHLSIHGDA